MISFKRKEGSHPLGCNTHDPRIGDWGEIGGKTFGRGAGEKSGIRCSSSGRVKATIQDSEIIL